VPSYPSHQPLKVRNRPEGAVIIAVASIRPNVGKTTIAVNLSASFVKSGRTCLLVDLAPSAEASWALGVRMASSSHSACAVLEGAVPIKALCLPTASGIDLVAGHRELAQFRGRQVTKGDILRGALQAVLSQYAYIVLDCPTRPRAVGAAALSVAHQVIIPYCQEDAFALPGDLLSPVQLAQISATVGFVASKAPDEQLQAQRLEYPNWPSAGFLGKVRYVAGLVSARRSGIPPVIAQPRTGFAHDLLALAQAVDSRVRSVEV
jgi:hypothetical protein